MTAERAALAQTVREFTADQIAPNIDEWERDGEIPRDLHKQAAALGLLGIGYPEDVGGSGAISVMSSWSPSRYWPPVGRAV